MRSKKSLDGGIVVVSCMVVGLLLGGGIGYLLGDAYVRWFMEQPELDAVVPPIIGIIMGGFIGWYGGRFIGLKLAGRRR